MTRKWLQLAAERLKCGMSKWPIEKIIQEAGLKGKDPRRGVRGEPMPESPSPSPTSPFLLFNPTPSGRFIRFN